MAHHPLLNKRIVVTRAEEQSEKIVSSLRKAGAFVLLVPTIKIIPADLSPDDKSHVSSFYRYDVAIFPSANSVKHLFANIIVIEHPSTKPYIIAIGKNTAKAASDFGFTPDFTPKKFTSEELIKSLAKFDWKAKRVLIPAGNLSNHEIAEFVESNGALADQVVVYKTLPNDSIDNEAKAEVRDAKFDIIIFYSPSQVRTFINIFGSDILKGKQIATIGPTTKKAVEHYNIEVSMTPDNSTTEDLVACLLNHEKI